MSSVLDWMSRTLRHIPIGMDLRIAALSLMRCISVAGMPNSGLCSPAGWMVGGDGSVNIELLYGSNEPPGPLGGALLGGGLGVAIAAGSDVTVPRSREGRVEPLCAVYRRRALHAIRTSLAAGQNKLSNFFPKVRCVFIPWSDLARAGFQPSVFDNMNTPEDYDYARRRLEGSTATFT